MRSGAALPRCPAPRLWFCDIDSIRSPGLLSRYAALLDPVERARLKRFRFERDQHRFLVSHALQRTVLSDVTGVDAAELRFHTEKHGKPFLEYPCPGNSEGLSFNLSHSGSHAVLAVWQGRGAIGVDIEVHRPDRPFIKLATRYFAESEQQFLRGVPAHEQMGCFYDLWTLKESYLKARGTGLALPLGDFSFALASGLLTFEAKAPLDDRPERWRFWCARICGGLSVALALESAEMLEPEVFEVTPAAASQQTRVDRVVACSR